MKSKLIFLGLGVLSVAVLATLFVKSWEMEKNKPQSETSVLSTQSVQPVSETDWTKGEKDARVVLIEYSDLQCPACAAYYPVTKKIVAEFGESIIFAYRHFPLRQIHFNSQLASQAAEAAGLQGKFWEMHDLLFENQDEWANSQDPNILFEKYAQNINLDIVQFKNDLKSETVRNEVEKDYQSGLDVGVNATPTFFLNGAKIQNPATLEEFRSIVQKEI